MKHRLSNSPLARRRRHIRARIKTARYEARQEAKEEAEKAVSEWLKRAIKAARKGDLSVLKLGPVLFPIECTADISALFTKAQHNLDEEFQKIAGLPSAWEGMVK